MVAVTANGVAIGIATSPARKGSTLVLERMTLNADLTRHENWYEETWALKFDVSELRADKSYLGCHFLSWDRAFALPMTGRVILFGVQLRFADELDEPWAEAL